MDVVRGVLRQRRFALLGAALLVLMASGCASSAHSGSSPLPVKPKIVLPACAPGDSPERLLAPSKLLGPAASSVSGGRVTRGWSVDGGAVKVTSAPVGERPAISERQAACNLIASMEPNGFPLAGITPTGSVLGYGRLSVSSTVAHAYTYVGGREMHPTPPSYVNRAAWILTVSFGPPSSCPAQPGPTGSSRPTPTPKVAHSWVYEVFAIDATTGREAITYRESKPANCNPRITEPAASTVPYESISLVWRGLSRSASGATGSIQVAVTSCDMVNFNGAWVNRNEPEVQVMATRRLGAACGSASWKTITLHPATVNQTIPVRLTHAPVGPIDHLDEQ